MSFLCPGMRQREVMISSGAVRIEREVELVLPTELKTSLGQSIVSQLGTGVPLGQVCRMGSKLVGNHALSHILTVRQAQVLLTGNIAEHGTAALSNQSPPEGPCNVVITRGNIRG